MSTVYLQHQHLLPPDLPLLALRDFVVQVRNAEEHGRQQERLLTATQQSCDQLKQQVQDQVQQIEEQRHRAAEVSPSSSFTHQTVYKRHIVCIPFFGCKVVVSQLIVWLMQGSRSQLTAMPTSWCRSACLHKHHRVQHCNALLQYVLTCLTAYYVCNRNISTDSHHQSQQRSSKPYNIPVTLDCNVQEFKTKSAQLAQQDAELAAAKQELATRLAAHEKSERVRPAPYVHILRGQRPATHVALQDLEFIHASHEVHINPNSALHVQWF